MPITGFTNGCFDAFHAGHHFFLNECRMRCSRLIVAVNSDASVTALKGEGRPIDLVAARLKNVSAYATEVYVFDTEEELRWMIGKLGPDVMFKGGDYSPQNVIGSEAVERVSIIPRLVGWSTTEVIENQFEDVK